MDNGPPRTLEDLQRIAAGHEPTAGPRLSSTAFRVLAALVEEPHTATMYSITDLARLNGVNASTLTRLAQRLGFSGFSELQATLRREVTETRGFYSRHADLLIPPSEDTSASPDTVDRLVQAELRNVRASLAELDRTALDRIAQLLAEGRRVYVLGLRQYFSVAHLIAYALGLVRQDVRLLGAAGHTLVEDVAGTGPGDVLLAISVRPFTQETLRLVDALRERAVTVVAVSDTRTEGLAEVAETTLLVRSEGPFFFNAMAAAIVLAEALVARAGQHLGDDALTALRRRESLFAALGTEFGGGTAKTPGQYWPGTSQDDESVD